MAILNEIKENQPNVKIFAGGCAESLVDLQKRGKIDGTFRRGKMIEDLSNYLNYDYTTDDSPINYHGAVRIQMGCSRNCGFCKKGYLDMPLTSKPLEKVLADIKSAIDEGSYDIELLAENATEYGLDLEPKVRLIDLLKEICALDGLEFLSVSALCIDELALDNELVEYIRNNKKIRKVQVEVQTLIPSVRKKMNLSSSIDDVFRILEAFKDKHIITNIMVGYPGETEADFQKQLQVIEDKQMYFIQVNQYDNTPFVPAYGLKQIPKAISDLRVLALYNTINKVRIRMSEEMIGSVVDCVYTLEGKFEMLGSSCEVSIKNRPHCYHGQVIKARITSYDSSISINPYMTMIFKGEVV